MQIDTSVQATTGLTGTIGVQIIDIDSMTILLPRTTTGITEIVAGSGVYVWSGTVADAIHYLAIWDTGGNTPSYGVDPINEFIPTAIPGAVPVATVGTLTWTIKRNDTAPSLSIQCLNINADGTTAPVNISGAAAYFHMAEASQEGSAFLPLNGTLQVDREIPVIDGPNGIVMWTPEGNDTNTSGQFLAEVEIHFTNGTIQTFPQNTYITVNVVPDIGNN